MARASLSPEGAATLAIQGRADLKPRFQVRVGEGGMMNVQADPGTVVTFPISANCMRSNFFAADRFKVVCSLYADANQSDDFWGDFDSMNIAVDIKFDGHPLTPNWIQVFRGVTDKVEFDLHKGTVTLTGRNFAALMIDQALLAEDGNTPMADVIDKIAKTHGLAPVEYGTAGRPTDTFGFVVSDEKHNGVLGAQTKDLTEWDLISRYAQYEKRVTYVKDSKLYFVTATESTEDGGTTGDGQYYYCQAPDPLFNGTGTPRGQGHVTKLGASNSIGLKVTHDLQFSQYAQVVATHNDHHVPSTTVIKHPPDEKVPEGTPIRRHYMQIQNMKPEDALKLVKNYHAVMTYREWLIEWKVAGPELLQADVIDLIELESAEDSALNGPFAISSIEYDISFQRGFVQIIKGVWGRSGQ